jgi:MoxR-like ATPase
VADRTLTERPAVERLVSDHRLAGPGSGPAVGANDVALAQAVMQQVARRVVGQEHMVERLLISLLTGGHVLLEGVPGLAKTLTVRTLAETIRTTFQRIQFTPDLLPADVIGTQVYDQSNGQFSVKRGPIFANIILADEINRAPAKVQAALLEAMQEHQVTIGGTTYVLDEPFLVLATQNPIEQEGTYPLPEAQVDRFMMKLRVGYPTREEEKEIMRRMAGGDTIAIDPVASPTAILEARRRIADLYMDERVVDYIVEIVHASRSPGDAGLRDLVPLIEFGASPRATIALAQASRAHAFLRGRNFVMPDDIKAVAPDVLRHRILTTFEAEAESVNSDRIVQRILGTVESP